MAELALAVIAFNRPRLIAEQIRLLRANLVDDFGYVVIDNSSNDEAAIQICDICISAGVGYLRVDTEGHEHIPALKLAWEVLKQTGSPFLGVIDHDVFPTRPTGLVQMIAEAGFFGVGQRHGPTDRLYLWPGFCFFSRDWLAGRDVDFDGIRGADKADDGDTGSAMWPLFTEESWHAFYRVEHSYRPIRPPDDYGLQSWGYETLGDWIHFSNGSHWMRVPDPEARDAALFSLLEGL